MRSTTSSPRSTTQRGSGPYASTTATQQSAVDFVDYVVRRFLFRIQTVRTDGGHESQAKPHWHVENLGMRHVYIRLRSPNLNGEVERSHLPDQLEFNQLRDYTDDVALRRKLAEWKRFCNFARHHAALNGLTPHEALRKKLLSLAVNRGREGHELGHGGRGSAARAQERGAPLNMSRWFRRPVLDRKIGSRRGPVCQGQFILIRARGGLAAGHYFNYIAFLQDRVQHFQVVQGEIDRLRVLIAMRKDAPDLNAEKAEGMEEIQHLVDLATGEECTVSFQFVDATEPTASGKTRYTVSKVHAE